MWSDPGAIQADSDFRIDPAEAFAQYELDRLYDLARNVLIHALTIRVLRPVI